MGMNKRELQEQIDNLSEQIKIYQDHLSFEQSKSSGLRANLRDKKRIIEENLKDATEQQKLIDRYSDRAEFWESKFKIVTDAISQLKEELIEQHKTADENDRREIESKIKAFGIVEILMGM